MTGGWDDARRAVYDELIAEWKRDNPDDAEVSLQVALTAAMTTNLRVGIEEWIELNAIKPGPNDRPMTKAELRDAYCEDDMTSKMMRNGWW